MPAPAHRARLHAALYCMSIQSRARDGTQRQARNPGRRGQVRRILRQQRCAQARFRRQGRPGRHDRHGYLPQLYAGRPLRLAAQDPAHQFLHLRLPVLHQPAHLERAAGALRGRRGGQADPGFLPAQLHRRPVPQLGHHPVGRLHDGAARRGGAPAARGASVPRLHPPQDHPRCRSLADPGSRPLGRPPVGEHRAADPRQRDPPRARKKRPHDQAGDGFHSPQAGRKSRRAEGAGLRAGRPEHADDRRRRRQRRPHDPEHGRDAVRQLQAQARVLLGLQPDPAKPRQRAAGAAAAAARAPPVPGRLFIARLRLHGW